MIRLPAYDAVQIAQASSFFSEEGAVKKIDDWSYSETKEEEERVIK